jgi:C-terminal peptidase prc
VSKRNFTVALVIFAGCLAFAAGKKMTNEEYWADTGLSGAALTALPYFQQANCTNNLKNYRGCISGLSSLASHGKNPLVLVPRWSVASGDIEKSFGPLVFVKPLAKEDVASLSLYKYWQKEKDRRDKVNAGVAALFNSVQRNIADFAQILEFARTNGLNEKPKEASYVAQALNEYLIEAVDPHSHFDTIAGLNSKTDGGGENFYGIGTNMMLVKGQVVVQSPMDGSPALKAGIRSNDIILKVDGQPLGPLTELQSIVSKIRGPLGSTVVLHILRDGKESDLSIVRGEITVKNLTGKILTNDSGKKIGYMKLNDFMDKNACPDMALKIAELQQDGAQDLILDLRGNPGGLMTQGICVGNLFVGDKLIVQVKDLASDQIRPEPSILKKQFTNLPLIVLIDANSASAAEIVAGALQDYGRAWILGEKSFGKATVQQNGPVDFNKKITIFQTIERFYQPSGRTNQIQGIVPDITVPLKPDATEEERFAMREADLYPNAFEALGAPWKQPRPDDVAKISACMAKTGTARQDFAARQKDAIQPDYQILAAEDAASCLP